MNWENIPCSITLPPPAAAWTQGRVHDAKSWPYHLCASAEILINQIRQHFYSPQLSSVGEQPLVSALGWHEWNLTRSPRYCAQKKIALVVCQYEYESLCSLTSTKQKYQSLDVFVFSESNTRETVVRDNPRISAVSEIREPSLLAPAVVAQWKSLRLHIYPILMCDVNIYIKRMAEWISKCKGVFFLWMSNAVILYCQCFVSMCKKKKVQSPDLKVWKLGFPFLFYFIIGRQV